MHEFIKKVKAPVRMCDWYIEGPYFLDDQASWVRDEVADPVFTDILFNTDCGDSIEFEQLDDVLVYKYCRNCGGKVSTYLENGEELNI